MYYSRELFPAQENEVHLQKKFPTFAITRNHAFKRTYSIKLHCICDVILLDRLVLDQYSTVVDFYSPKPNLVYWNFNKSGLIYVWKLGCYCPHLRVRKMQFSKLDPTLFNRVILVQGIRDGTIFSASEGLPHEQYTRSHYSPYHDCPTFLFWSRPLFSCVYEKPCL